MREHFDNEQYFFNKKTIKRLIHFIAKTEFNNVCVLCAPFLAEKLTNNQFKPTILDIDTRFSYLENFIFYDLENPSWIEEDFDLIICDPPFFSYRLSILVKTINMLSHYNYKQKVLISYLERREKRFLNAFENYRLKPTAFFPKYRSVRDISKNKIQFYSNLQDKFINKLID
jgi:16S rRNA G966 N2-methylase RsmD